MVLEFMFVFLYIFEYSHSANFDIDGHICNDRRFTIDIVPTNEHLLQRKQKQFTNLTL